MAGTRIAPKEREKLKKQVASLYKKGSSVREIQDETGKSYGFIYRLLHEAEVTLRSRGGARSKGKTAAKTTVAKPAAKGKTSAKAGEKAA